MVAPASEALICQDCHTPESGRLDFVALGYDEANVKRLTKFPPTFSIENLITPQMSPDSCKGCHTDEHELWAQSLHGDKGVGCVSCHKLQTAGEHPAVPFTMEKSAETCGACHLNEFDDWKTSAHGQINVDCSSCHNPHSQQIMTIGDNKTACETCHTSTKEETQHSTHAAAGLTCVDCHKNTELNTGHAFMISSDTCLKCHADTIHTADLMLNAGVDMGQEPSVAATPVVEPETAAEQPTGGAGIALPTWSLILVGLGLGVGIHWLLSTRRLANEQSDGSESDESDEESKK
jgi:hypothetical protein